MSFAKSIIKMIILGAMVGALLGRLTLYERAYRPHLPPSPDYHWRGE